MAEKSADQKNLVNRADLDKAWKKMEFYGFEKLLIAPNKNAIEKG